MKLREKSGSVVSDICKAEALIERPKKRRRRKKIRSPKMKALPVGCIQKECITMKTLTCFARGAEVLVKKCNHFYLLKIKHVISGEKGSGPLWYKQEDLEVFHPEEPETYDPKEKPEGFWKGEMHVHQAEVVHVPPQYIEKIVHACAFCPICTRVQPYDILDESHVKECLRKLKNDCEEPSHGEVMITDMNLIASFRRKLARGPVGWRHFGAFTSISVALSKLPELLDDVRENYAVAKLVTAQDLKFCSDVIDENWDAAKPSIHHPTAVVDWSRPITAKIYYGKNFYDYDTEAEKVPSGTVTLPYLDFQVFLKTL